MANGVTQRKGASAGGADTARARRGENPATRRGDGPGMVADALRIAITRGELSPNERLVEADLAARYGVGRAAVRTALFELDKEGLIVREQSRGARVRAISVEEAIEIAEARMVNEGLCAAKAAERATEDEIDELREIVESMQLVHVKNDLLGYSDLNQKLHRRIREISRHETASRIVEQLRNQSVRQSFRIALLPGRTAVSLREHEAIVSSIANHDETAAETAMHDHLRSVIDALHELQMTAPATAYA